MTAFPGYPEGPVRWVPLPEPFFTQILPQVEDPGLLHLLLFTFWHLSQQEDEPRYVPEEAYRTLLEWPAWHHRSPQDLNALLDRAVAQGYLLRGEARFPQGTVVRLYFLPSPKGRAAWQALQAGRWQPQEDPHRPVRLDLDRPTVFRLYEENIGPLTPLIVERLEEAQRLYPTAWIEDAIRIAVERNVRNWRYVEAILRRWMQEGRHDQAAQGRAETDYRRYLDSPYASLYEG